MSGVEPSSGDSLIGPVPGLQAAVVADHLIVLEPRSHRRVLLNPSAAFIFTAIEERRRLDDLVAQIAEETGLDTQDLVHDVRATVDRLLVQGMLERDDSPAAPPAAPPDDRADAVSAVDENRSDPTAGVDWTFDSGPLSVAGSTVVFRSETQGPAGALKTALAGFAPAASGDTAAHRIEVIAAGHEAETGRPSSGAPAESFEVVVDGEVRTGRLDSADVIVSVLDQLDLVLIDHADGLRFHAGAVERDGSVVVIMGESGQGKSTFTAALVQAGWSYLTDELVVVDAATLGVHGYARSFDLDDTSRALLGNPEVDLVTGDTKAKVRAERFGATSDGGTVALNVLLTGEAPDQRGGPLVEVVAPAEAAMSILTLTFVRTFDDPEALAHIGALCEQVPTVRLDRGPLSEMILAVEQHLSGRDMAMGGTAR